MQKNENNEYRIIQYNKQNFHDVVKLYEESYRGRKQSLQYFKYRLNDTPFGKPIIHLMKFQDRIVGFYAIHPIMMNIRKKNLLAGYSYLTMTHPAHTGKGIFTKLAKSVYSKAKKSGYYFIFGFANKNSYPNFINRLGFKEISPINFIKIKQKDIHSKINFNSYYPKKIDELWKKYYIKNNFKVYVNRNHKIVCWRYRDHPSNKYFTYYEKDKAFFIFKKFEHTLHVIDFFGEDEYIKKNFIDISRKYCTKYSCKEVTLWIPQNSIIDSFPKQDFQKITWDKSFFIVKILNKSTSKTILNIQNWYYTMNDADHF